MKHEDYKEMIALDALGVLDGDVEGRRALDAHLAGCADCRAERGAFGDAAASLAYAAPAPEAPAPELRARILAAVTSQPQDVRQQDASAAAAAPAAHATSHTSNVSLSDEFERRREAREIRVGRRVLMLGSLAASVAVAALLVTLALVWQRNGRLQNELARLSETVNRTQQELARTREDRELLALPAAHSATLLSQTEAAGKAHARLTFDAQTGRAMLTAADLPPVPAGKAYQLWFIAAGKPPMPGSVFRPDARGHAEMYETVPPEGRAAAVIFAVTLEPAAGVSAPTGEIYLKSTAS